MKADELLRSLLADGPLVRAEAPFQVLRVHGPDAAEFLHRLCTQDIVGMRDGDLRPAAFLDAKGKLQNVGLVARMRGEFRLEVRSERAAALATLLERYHFTEKLAIETMAATSCREVVVGVGIDPPATGGVAALAEGIEFRFARRGVQFVRVHGGDAVGGAPGDDERFECVRLLAGCLRVGIETEPNTLALEADLDDHINTTKGCYTGQEIVARIHTYGHVNRKACLLWLAAGAPITAAQELQDDDEIAVGRVLHAVSVPGGASRLGVGYLPKDFHALGTKLRLADGGAVEVIGYEPPG